MIERTDKAIKKRYYLLLSIILNFGMLFIYKYFDFLNSSIHVLMDRLSVRWPVPNLDLLLPVGISFFTFQAVGYTIDVYRGQVKAEKHFGYYALFISFFPQLVAGPIERSKHLLPQFREVHFFDFNNLEAGIKQMIWGFFMKLVVADRLAMYVQPVYGNLELHNGTTILLATIFFAFQIYCDFAGYSNIAIGTARIMGFDLMNNFKRPYFATNITEFWHRWHISLSTWFRDYVYIPLGGNRFGHTRTKFNLFVTFMVSGIWHGANWTFLVWGGLHGVLQVIEKSFGKIKESKSTVLNLSSVLKVFLTFSFVTVTWIFFRASGIDQAFIAINRILTTSGIPFKDANTFIYGGTGLLILFTREFFNEFYPGKFLILESKQPVVSGIAYSFLVLVILLIGILDQSQFIYFQF